MTIKFNNLNKEKPFQIFKLEYDKAVEAGQKGIEVVVISSFDVQSNTVDSRCVNLKFVTNDEFIFFSNYESSKASAFKSHNQIAALVYWPVINVQIRFKAHIKKTSREYNKKYFFNRAIEKNALAISSKQSKPIHSYEEILKKYERSLSNSDLKECPSYWGGFSFKPYEIEFWKGHQFRLNKRNLYLKKGNTWQHSILEP